MKVLIVSDSHGLTKELAMLRDRYIGEIDVMIHCGDSELSSTSNEIVDYKVVRGNCDFDVNFLNDQLMPIDGIMFYITHGICTMLKCH